MASFISKASALAVIVTVGLCACTSLNPVPKSAKRDGMNAAQYRAASEIAAARCARQTAACSSFSSRSECIEAKFRASAADTGLAGCSNDVDQRDVQACVAEVERGRCGTGVAHLEACNESRLCPYTSEEGTF